MQKTPRFVPVIAFGVLFTSLMQTSSIAESEVLPIPGIDIVSSYDSIEISWSKVPGAVEYVAYDELPKDRNLNNLIDPIYRGSDPFLRYDDLGSREVSRIRLLAIDGNENVVARSLIRTNTQGAGDSAKEVNWIASSEGLEIFLGKKEDEIPIFGQGGLQGFRSEEPSGSFRDPEFNGEEGVYLLTSEHQVNPTRVQKPDSVIPESVPINITVDIPDFQPPEDLTLESEDAAVREAALTQTMGRTFEWEAFIADDYIPAPFLCDTAWEEIGDMHFGGDNRDFSRSTRDNTNRIVLWANANFMWPEFTGFPSEFRGWREPYSNLTMRVGTTQLYQEHNDGSMELIQEETAPMDELQITEAIMNRTTGEFYITSDSTNPLCDVLGFFEAPAITVSVNVILYSDGTYIYSGFRDAAPHHQAVIDTRRIQTFPEPSRDQYYESYLNPHTTCVHKHVNSGFLNLAFPPVPISFNNNDHSDPSASGDCSTVDP